MMNEVHLAKIVDVLKEMTSDWDLDMEGDIGSDTQLIADLAFESIDIVEMVVAIEQAFENLLSLQYRTYFDWWSQRLIDEMGRPRGEWARRP